MHHIPQFATGRKKKNRLPFMIALAAMRVLNIPQTNMLIDRLRVDPVLRRICLFPSEKKLPCEATFSNVFAEFAELNLIPQLHEMLVKAELADDLIHHVSRDSTAIAAREKPVAKPKKKPKPKNKPGRPKKGENLRPKELKRLDKQPDMSLEEMLKDLPISCDKGGKKDAKGNKSYWNGYKLHIDTIDGDIPVSAILTSASLHDSQVAIPLEEMTNDRLTSLYSLMDSAYDAPQIKSFIESKDKIAVIDHNPRRSGVKIPFDPPKKERYKERSSAERVNAYLKDNGGITGMRYRGAAKLMAHLGMGLLVIAVEQLLKLA
jgi:hypothetical protein